MTGLFNSDMDRCNGNLPVGCCGSDFKSLAGYNMILPKSQSSAFLERVSGYNVEEIPKHHTSNASKITLYCLCIIPRCCVRIDLESGSSGRNYIYSLGPQRLRFSARVKKLRSHYPTVDGCGASRVWPIGLLQGAKKGFRSLDIARAIKVSSIQHKEANRSDICLPNTFSTKRLEQLLCCRNMADEQPATWSMVIASNHPITESKHWG
ncbi:predicted protein [Sclerotinia sclerotiorum 1980 UF-70]|uniref:Uncharacterized protein n=1 Tax=Sclerotinia sclerotiorum (strain ATCC 18683 / 1980 / Ss-1) TaxID=665079 RepID=A7EAS8_SCLS1|nr:predicted protein [Sclerotinia sclerotiorum 1980 UF-70]EDN99556.1 predicted protein [Sclerotinia sclerotiorum 1980 UF-70]